MFGGKTLSSCSMSFTKNVVGAETSYQMLEVLSLIMTVRGLNLHLVKITVLTFLVNQKYEEAFRGVYFFRINKKTFSQILYLSSFLSLNLKVSVGYFGETKNKCLTEEVCILW